eukprot:TRINITY_DN1738_c0_g1_i3.p1 TRINITY_DN1738_c0_g1~~TRINITY_DN1738_c0_g1_i3.p1  ORF type:complete len:293 (+),score=67.08 TRINITY_DN1738_c0_g1_i3:652-1530(+)
MYGPPPEFDKTKPTWCFILQAVLFSLKCFSPDVAYFSLKDDIYTFVDDHWDYLNCGKDRNSPWRQTVKMTLSRYNEVFENGYNELNKRGLWRLRDDVDPYKIPIYTMVQKNPNVERCRFCADHFTAEYERRKDPTNSWGRHATLISPQYPPVKLEQMKPKIEMIKKEMVDHNLSTPLPYDIPNFQMKNTMASSHRMLDSTPEYSSYNVPSYTNTPNIHGIRMQHEYAALLQSMSLLHNLKKGSESTSTASQSSDPFLGTEKEKEEQDSPSKGSLDFILESSPSEEPGKWKWQ